MLYNNMKVEVLPKSSEQRLREILARPRNTNARIRLAMPRLQPKKQECNK